MDNPLQPLSGDEAAQTIRFASQVDALKADNARQAIIDDEIRGLSFNDLLFRFGQSLEVAGRVHTQSGSRDATARPFDIPPVEGVNMNLIERLDRYAQERRAEMGEERWLELGGEPRAAENGPRIDADWEMG